MISPLHAAYYPDRAIQAAVEIVENVRLARDTYRVRFHSPAIAARIVPGQFLMLRIAGLCDPLIGRPFALYDTTLAGDCTPACIDVVYLVKGKLSNRLLTLCPGQQLDVWGPLGNGFLPQPTEHLIMVAGGIGQTPFLALAQEYLGHRRYGDPPRNVSPAQRVTFCYGARTAEYFAGIDDFVRLGIDVRLATDDGSRGHHGLVTDLLREVLAEQTGLVPRVVCCGPEPMMQAVARVAKEAGAMCEVSLETPMACGIGICFTCVAKVRDEQGEWDYKRTCVEGPVFPAEKLVW
jgi:dihydroorotate dehydrogenase electron transfer subunit